MKNSSAAEKICSLPIETWHALSLEGNVLPVKITLDGDSMRPLIRRGRDTVTILPVHRALKKGDIVLFKGGETRYVVHRIYKIQGESVQTFGDNCYKPDAWIPVQNVWGIVTRMERNGKTCSLDNQASRVFGRLWMLLHPVRMFYKRTRSLAGRCFRKFFPKKERR